MPGSRPRIISALSLRIAHHRRRSLARIAFALAVAVASAATMILVAGCQRDEAPQLLQVLDVAPREAEVGERLEIAGSGFPQGRTAHVTFRGTLYRPGAAPATGAEVATTGTVTSAQAIEVPFTETLQALFSGAGESKAHTTFEGEVEVAFEAAAAGAPPVAGSLAKVLLDIRPPTAGRGVETARVADGERLLRFVGITVGDASPVSGGLLVATVEPGSRAEEAGVLAGDLLVSLDHVRIHGRDDAVVAPGRAVAELGVRRDGSAREEVKSVRVQGATAFGAAELAAAAVVLVVAAGLLVVLFAPPWPFATWFERRIAARLLRRGSSDLGHPRLAASTSWSLRSVAAAVGITVAFVAVPLAQRFAASDLDVGILFLLSVTALATMGLFEGVDAASRGIVTGLRGALRVASYVTPGALAVVGVVVMTGSLRVDEIVRAQGGLPWEWYAFRSPVSAALCALLIATAVAPGDRDAAEHAGGSVARAAVLRPPSQARAIPHAERVYAFVVAGVTSAVFLGGWEVPFAAPGAASAHVALALVGCALFSAKAWTVVAAIAALRATLPSRRIDETAALSLRYLTPMAVAMLGLTVAWVALRPSRGAQSIVSASMFVLFCLALIHLATRVRYHLRASSGGGSLNPFL